MFRQIMMFLITLGVVLIVDLLGADFLDSCIMSFITYNICNMVWKEKRYLNN